LPPIGPILLLSRENYSGDQAYLMGKGYAEFAISGTRGFEWLLTLTTYKFRRHYKTKYLHLVNCNKKD
jgi:hypothetical protein